MRYREEQDSIGTVSVPEEAYYGAQTERARLNFIDSGLKLPTEFIQSLAMVKRFAAEVNQSLDLLDSKCAGAIVESAREVMRGELSKEFVVDIFQTGSGTSTNMNMNEVIAGRANEILTGHRGGKRPVHPNDHVNLGQSSNDVIPTAIHIAVLTGLERNLIPGMKILWDVLKQKSKAFKTIRKIGRTHLQDAVPMRLGDEFGGYARQVELAVKRIESTFESLKELALGGTAVGNGLNANPLFAGQVIARISGYLGIDFREAENHFEAQAAKDALVEASGALRTAAVSLTKIANDVRWLSSGPRCGLGEINLPSLQPGSSIMPGKVNPVIPESLLQIAAQVIGNDTTVMLAGQGGSFELNTMMPLIAYNLMQSIHLMELGVRLFAEKCIKGISANEETCESYVDKSLAIATYLVPVLGYDRAAAVSKKAHETGRRIREIVVEEGIMSGEAFDKLVKGDE
jgi:fumarate hydratase class II